jgi:amidase
MARTVKDAAYVLQAIAGVDPYDNYTSAIPNNGTHPDYDAACNYSALLGARIGIARNVIALSADNTTGPQTDAFEDAIEVLRDAGATIVDNTNFTAAADFLNSTSETEVLNADFIVNLASYLAILVENPNNVTTLADVRNFTQDFPLEDYPDRDTAIWDAALDTQGYNNTDPRFWAAYQQDLYFGNEGGLLGALERDNLDAVILPTNFASSWAAIVGAPIVTVPLGFYPWNATVVPNRRGDLVALGPNIPYDSEVSYGAASIANEVSRFGLSFLGAKWTEAKLIGLAYAFEQRTMVRDKVQPYIVPSIELGEVLGA